MTMRKQLLSIFLTGMITFGGFSQLSSTHAQRQYDWGNPEIPYVEQRGFSLGVNFGSTDLWGDVGTKSVIDHYINNNYYDDILGNMRAMGGIFARYTHIPGISFRLGINYGQLYATDKWNEEKAFKAKTIADDAYQRYMRNLDVSTNIWEGNFLFEFSPFRISNWEFGRLTNSKVQPYILLGVSGFHFNPQGTFLDLESGRETLVDLQPLHTEGQGF